MLHRWGKSQPLPTEANPFVDRLQVFSDRHGAVPQHIDVTSHLVIIPGKNLNQVVLYHCQVSINNGRKGISLKVYRDQRRVFNTQNSFVSFFLSSLAFRTGTFFHLLKLLFKLKFLRYSIFIRYSHLYTVHSHL